MQLAALDRSPLLALIVAVAGCKPADVDKSAPASKPSPPAVTSLPLVADKTDDEPVELAGSPPVDDACATGVRNFYKVLSTTGTAEEKAAYLSEAGSLAHCRDHHWPASLVDCARTLTAVDQWQTKCFKVAFSGELDLKPKRRFDPAEYLANKYADLNPAAMTADGDFMGGHDGCGSITKVAGPAMASFIVCAGSVVAGPLTTVAEVKSVYAERAKQSADAFELGRRIRARWPSGCSNCRYRVYDDNGNHLRDE